MHNSPHCKIAVFVVTAVLLALIAGALSFYGNSRRVYLTSPLIEIISEPHQAFPIWKDRGIKGRVLLLFDRHLNMESPADIQNEININGIPVDSYLRPDNYIYMALRNSIFRKVYHIIPEASWPDVVKTLEDSRFIIKKDNYYTITLASTPVVIMRLRDVPPMAERVVATINTDKWTRSELQHIVNLLRNHSLSYDLITVCGKSEEQAIAALAEQSNARP